MLIEKNIAAAQAETGSSGARRSPAAPLLHLIGAATNLGAPDWPCAEGPQAIRARLERPGHVLDNARWRTTLRGVARPGRDVPVARLAGYAVRLAGSVRAVVRRRHRFVVIGGDHASAIGTWNGARSGLGGALGLIWIDAHMDAHQPNTTPSGRAHGMPLACLLGSGVPRLAQLEGHAAPCLKGEHVCLIGVRSFEPDEDALLKRLQVRVYFMEEVERRGLEAIMDEALARVCEGTRGFGVTLDLDAIDPQQAPGVTSPEPAGLNGLALVRALAQAARRAAFIGAEIAEYTPAYDIEARTASLIERMLRAIAQGSLHSDIEDVRELEARYCARNYEPLPVVLTRGRGVHVWDRAGRRYIDMMSAYSAVSFGHAHPRLLRALNSQARKLSMTSRAYYSEHLGPLAKKLCELTGMDRMLPMNTGAEALETAVKAVRKWAYQDKGVREGRAQIIACEGNFHGRTLAAVAMSSEPQYRAGFGPFPPGFVRIPFGDAAALEAAITDDSAAFLVEPIQGESGIVLPPPGYLAACAQICRRRNVLLVCDEVQTGLGRTGRVLASQHEDVQPDGLLLGKALGGGLLPISAFLARAELMQVFTPGDHGSTFGGNPLACAVAVEALDVLVAERLAERSAELGEYLLSRLRGLDSPLIRAVRGKGLFIGVEIDRALTSARLVAELLLREGVLTKDTHDTVLRFAPPLTIERAELDDAIERIDHALLVAARLAPID